MLQSGCILGHILPGLPGLFLLPYEINANYQATVQCSPVCLSPLELHFSCTKKYAAGTSAHKIITPSMAAEIESKSAVLISPSVSQIRGALDDHDGAVAIAYTIEVTFTIRKKYFINRGTAWATLPQRWTRCWGKNTYSNMVLSSFEGS